MKRKIIMACIIMIYLITCSCWVQAESVIQSAVEIEGENVRISGQISEVYEKKQVALFVGERKKILYLDQNTSSEDGCFEFQFQLPENLEAGNYTYNVGSDSGAQYFSGILNYPGKKVKTRLVNADFLVNISGYVPQITGSIQSLSGTTTELRIENITDQYLIANDVFREGSGLCEVSYTLPSLLSAKKYRVSVVCHEGEREIIVSNLMISSRSVLVSAEGNVDLKSAEASVDLHIRSNQTGLIDKSKTFAESGAMSLSIPNIVRNTSYSLSIQGYENRFSSPKAIAAEYKFTGGEEQEIKVIARAKNMVSFFDKKFVLSYSPEEVEAVSFCGLSDKKDLSNRRIGQIEILSHETGTIVFKVVGINVPAQKSWEGAFHVFRFRFKPGYSGTTTLYLKED